MYATGSKEQRRSISDNSRSCWCGFRMSFPWANSLARDRSKIYERITSASSIDDSTPAFLSLLLAHWRASRMDRLLLSNISLFLTAAVDVEENQRQWWRLRGCPVRQLCRTSDKARLRGSKPSSWLLTTLRLLDGVDWRCKPSGHTSRLRMSANRDIFDNNIIS